MMDSFVRRWGKAAALALMTALLSTLVMAAVVVAETTGMLEAGTTASLGVVYMGTMGVIGGATQAPNFAERLPGHRSWDNPHRLDGQSRRASDRMEGE